MSEQSSAAVIYVVTAGTYSDYGIVGVYTDKSLAETCAAMIDDGQVEEHEPNPEADRLRQGLKHYRVSMQGPDGNNATAWPADQLRASDYGSPKSEYYCAFVWAKDERQAIKAANERRLQLIASA